MITKAKWLALAERCEKATVQTRNLGRDLALAVGWQRFTPSQVRRSSSGWIAPEDYLGRKDDGSPILDQMHGTDVHRDAPLFEASLDAITALIERELPEMQWLCRPDAKGGFGNLYPKSHFDLVDYPIWPSYAATPALALCAAFAKAMAEKAA